MTVFLTEATGFLGAYLINEILGRPKPKIKLIAHVRGAKNPAAALERLQRSLRGNGVWKDEWSSRLSSVVGDLSQPQLGIDILTWKRPSKEVDVVIHNGASVHWVKRYHEMMPPNVLSTIDAMRLCNEGKPKRVVFVSSTAELDSDHYIKLSEDLTRTGQGSITEESDMLGSRTGLGTGYGQTK